MTLRSLLLAAGLAFLASAPASAAPKLSLTPPLSIQWTERQPEAFAMDDGGGAGIQGRERKIVAYLLAIFIGFGTGHLVMGDDNGFVFWLIVDAVILVAGELTAFLFFHGNRYVYVAYIVSHVLQVVELVNKGGSGGDLPPAYAFWSPPEIRTRGVPAFANSTILSF